MSRKTTAFLLGGGALALSLFLGGCQSQESHTSHFSYTGAKYSSTTAYMHHIDIQLDATEKALNTLKFYIDVDNNDSNSTLRSVNRDGLDLEKLGEILPADLSTLKRSLKSSLRSSEEANTTQITLAQELQEIADAYHAALIASAPDMTKALTLSYVTKQGDGLVVDENFIDPKTMQGAIMIEMLNALADGANIEDLIEEQQAALATLGLKSVDEESNGSIRGFYKTDTNRWGDGNVFYNFSGSLHDTHKVALQEAMADWQEKTNNAVTFKNYDDLDGWTKFWINIGFVGCVEYTTENLAAGTAGSAQVGAEGLFGTNILKIDTNLAQESFRRVTRHELGHVLGLIHEHQRYDRDNHIAIPTYEASNSSSREQYAIDYGIVGRGYWSNNWNSRWVQKGFTTWWGSWISYWVLDWYQPYIRTSVAIGSYDCDSIMQYHGMRIIDASCTNSNNKDWTGINENITQTDADTVKKLYNK